MKTDTMRVTFLVLFAVLIALFAVITWPFATAAFLAFTLAVIFFPLQSFVVTRLRLPRYIAALLTTIIVAVCVLFPLALVTGIVISKVGQFLQGVVNQVEQGMLSATLQPLFITVQGWIEKVFGSAPSVQELQAMLIEVFKEAGKKFYELSPRVLSTTISIVGNFLLMLLFLVVFLAEGSNLYHWLMETTPLSDEHRKELAREVRVTITSSILAALVIAVVQGALLGLGFWLAGFEQPYGWGLVAMILSLIPVVGAAACYITASIMLFSSGQTRAATIFLVFGLGIISTIDNFIRPLVVRGTARMHPLLLFVTIVGAVKLMGPVGLIVGPVLLAIFLASLRIYRREFAHVGS